jgi:hypothetical protein
MTAQHPKWHPVIKQVSPGVVEITVDVSGRQELSDFLLVLLINLGYQVVI